VLSIRLCAQRLREHLPIFGLQIDDDAALVAIHRTEQAALAVRERTDRAIVVAARRLDLDDVGAEIAEQRRTQRPRQHPGKIDHAYAVERQPGHSHDIVS
jgi:hypothetical protein